MKKLMKLVKGFRETKGLIKNLVDQFNQQNKGFVTPSPRSITEIDLQMRMQLNWLECLASTQKVAGSCPVIRSIIHKQERKEVTMNNHVIDEVIEILINWYQDGKIKVIDTPAIEDAYRERLCGADDSDVDNIVALVLHELQKDEDKEVLLKEGTIV